MGTGLGPDDRWWTADSLRPWVLACVEEFGVERSFFGSNWPVERLYSSYGDVLDAYLEIIGDYSKSDSGRCSPRTRSGSSGCTHLQRGLVAHCGSDRVVVVVEVVLGDLRAGGEPHPVVRGQVPHVSSNTRRWCGWATMNGCRVTHITYPVSLRTASA